MPLKLNVGLSKKKGLPDYGSLGASCYLEVEVEHDVVRQPEALHDKIRYLFARAKAAVEEELRQDSPPARNGAGHKPGSRAGGNGNSYGNANGHGGGVSGDDEFGPAGARNGRKATPSQCRAIFAIAGRMNIDVPGLLQRRFGVNRPEDLGVAEASGVIDELQVEQNGEGEPI